MKRSSNLPFLGFIGVALFIVTTLLAGLQTENYSHLSHLISESYAIGTPYGVWLRYFGFIPSGICLFLFSILAIQQLPKSANATIALAGIGIFYGLGTVVVSIFPCSEGCETAVADPVLSQMIHNLSGMLTYLIVPVCLIVLGNAARTWPNDRNVATTGIICGVTAIIFVALLTINIQSPYAGLYQRIVEGSILLFILITANYLQKEGRPGGR
jgi:Protein of unknown function (DUF998)